MVHNSAGVAYEHELRNSLSRRGDLHRVGFERLGCKPGETFFSQRPRPFLARYSHRFRVTYLGIIARSLVR